MGGGGSRLELGDTTKAWNFSLNEIKIIKSIKMSSFLGRLMSKSSLLAGLEEAIVWMGKRDPRTKKGKAS